MSGGIASNYQRLQHSARSSRYQRQSNRIVQSSAEWDPLVPDEYRRPDVVTNYRQLSRTNAQKREACAVILIYRQHKMVVEGRTRRTANCEEHRRHDALSPPLGYHFFIQRSFLASGTGSGNCNKSITYRSLGVLRSAMIWQWKLKKNHAALRNILGNE